MRNRQYTSLIFGIVVWTLGSVSVGASEDPLFVLPNDFTAVELSQLIGMNNIEDSSDSIDPIMLVSGAVSPQRYSYAVRSFVWNDPARRRSVPAKIYYPTATDQRYPIIVFSHGLGGSYDCCSYLGESWASRGFVVVLLQHPGSDENVWKGKLRIMNELREAYKYHWSGRTRALDIRFAIDRLHCLAQTDGRFSMILNLNRIGVGGYDLGSLGALLVAGQLPPDNGPSLADPRVKAVLAMSPPINPPRGGYQNVYGSINVPSFFITGTEDDGIVGTTKAQHRRIPFDSMSGCSRYLVVFDGSDHMVYGGHFLSLRARKDKRFQNAICRITAVFWRAYLRGEEQAQTYVSGYRLNSMLGVAATVERRIDPSDFVVYRTETVPCGNADVTEKNAEPAQPEPAEENPTAEPLQPPNKSIPKPAEENPKVGNQFVPPTTTPLLTPTFPITPFYREVVSNVDAE